MAQAPAAMTNSSPELPDLPLIGAADLPTPTAAPAAAKPRGRLRLFLLPVVAAGCFAAGVAGSIFARGEPADEAPSAVEHHEPAPHAEAPPHHEEAPHPAVEPHPPAGDHRPGSHRERIDLAARAGRFAEALALLREGPPEHLGLDERAVAYREGVCLEGLGRWDEAAGAYAKAADPDAPGWPELGQARCRLAAGDRPAARGLLNRVSIVCGADGHLLGECLHLRGRLLLLDGGPPSAPDPLDADALAWPMPASRGEHSLAHLPNDHHSPEADHRPEGAEVHRSFWFPELPEVTAVLRNRPAAAFFDGLRADGLKVTVDPASADRLTRTVTIDVGRVPLAEVLSALGESLGFGWRRDGDGLAVGPADPERQQEALSGALRRAVAVAPDHPLADAARVALGNQYAEAGRWRPAADEYRRFLDTRPNAAEGVQAAYNLGLLELRDGNLPAARSRFLEVIDRGPRTPWADLGRWWVARTHLDAGDTAAARTPLRMAFDGPSKDVRSAAALGLVAADLFDGDADAARSFLRSVRFGTGDADAATAGWFGAWLRYRVAPSDGRAAELIALVDEGQAGRPLGPLGVYLAGQACREIGRAEQMAALYDRATETCRGPLAVRMTFESAEYLWGLDRLGPARQRFLAVAAVDPTGLGLTAELRLAELAARVGRGADCVDRCRRLLVRPGADPAEVLPVMARGYELEGRHRAAADCLAGRVPGE
ncbi:MAG: tetratricopeptide repeat protein [Gemmataceae bacterium]|nr:tetratricopeptide repeat protein [Gemmataceae bacterium]